VQCQGPCPVTTSIKLEMTHNQLHLGNKNKILDDIN
jgi:hypothetical protein